ncbi:MAG: signal peptidase II [Terrisporobacter sp.]|uniref:signal peptidase II n=1 Tax=Terrisporobacter sp. TaxID=1965305 RepID=UPI002A4896A1|nr:signal peptidase II [Terrisporobacter sp.]MCI6456647.1 signal peptidase II [Clostridium sp.]MDD5877767.1 signal peptidase II [Clostridiales bacterium]MDY4735128.1 signal peptidase II [Terrisporobacter sp.]MDY6154069.1 signal peptidase II [Terrisporobacter sp.]
MYEIIIAILIGLDQIIKYWALNSLKEVNSIPVINNIFSLTYVENRGAAFGMLQNNQSIFILVAAVASCFGLYYLHSKKVNNLGKIGILLVISGAIGNLIDRVRLGFVVDYLDFHIIWSYVFNLADCFVVVGTILLCLYIITSKE